ncbi:MAG TPA: extracellular solute-binding protein [Lachnospiraceae bacterium]|nr:extracellular solute-binding protein [Lachnospiraceae bacterium]
MKRKKKIFLAGCLCALAVSAVLAIAVINRSEKETILKFAMFSDSNWGVSGDNTSKIVEQAIKEFEEEHPGVKVVYESGIRKEDYTEWLEGKILLGEEPDIFMVSADVFNILASKGALLDLREFMDEDQTFREDRFYHVAIESGEFEQKQYALPYESVPMLMAVNITLLNELQIDLPENDWTWSDFHAICRRVTRDTDSDGKIDQFGVYNYTWKDAAYTNGTLLFDKNGKENYVSHQDVINAVNYVHKINMLTDGYLVTAKDFESGTVAFSPMLLSEYRMYKNYPYSIEKYNNFEWTCLTMPAGPKGDNISEVDTLLTAISSRSNYRKLAWEFMKKLTCDEGIQERVARESKGVSVLKDVTENTQVYDPEDEIDRSLLSLSMQKGVIVPRFYQYDEAMRIMDEGVQEAMESEKNIKASLIALHKKIDSFLKNE